MKALELLAPARTADIGIAAIDCGADAVYIAGPAFGARQAAGNSIEDIARLCEYARRYGVRIYATVNTLLEPEERPLAQKLVQDLEKAGVDALIVQDPAVLSMSDSLIMHASTQCALRTPEKARGLESLGFGRLVLERELSLEQIKAISEAVHTEIEFFVHGALCVCYSGQCYLSEYLTGRSANRGACAQPCRSLYDLEDAEGKVLIKNKPLLSLKDYNLYHRLEDLAKAGVSSFKIEGRLKGESYVRNVVKAYSEALDRLVARFPDEYCRASFGRVSGGFTPDLNKTFNRGYTELFLDGKRGQWAAEGGGEYVGKVKRLTPAGFILDPASPDIKLCNGDGFTFEGGGVRADIAEGYTVQCKKVDTLKEGTRLYRNISTAFEKQLEAAKPVREIPVQLSVEINGSILVKALSEDGRAASIQLEKPVDIARDAEKMVQNINMQLGKRSGHYSFSVRSLAVKGDMPFMTASFLNGIRRDLAEQLDQLPVQARPLYRGVRQPDSSFRLEYRNNGELMRTKYCIRYQLGLCPRQGKVKKAEPLFLRNGKERLQLTFNCAECEMTVTAS
ncbi:MAG TPA: collagenase-like protease [Rikenellaceae bacterium]|nr:collagenase-like protease [Rikenellaceae bacterium]